MREFNQPHLVELPELLIEPGIAYFHFRGRRFVDCSGCQIGIIIDCHICDLVEQGLLIGCQGPDRRRKMNVFRDSYASRTSSLRIAVRPARSAVKALCLTRSSPTRRSPHRMVCSMISSNIDSGTTLGYRPFRIRVFRISEISSSV